MGRSKGRQSVLHEMFIIGEQLRTQMTEQGQVRDRRYHLRKYRKCFVAKDAIDWCIKLYHVTSRKEAVAAMRVLVKVGVIHHVLDEQEFKDAHLFFRFTRDDDTYRVNSDLTAFYAGVELYRKLKQTGTNVLQQVYHRGNFFPETFTGCELLDFLCASGRGRVEAAGECRGMMEQGVMRHVTDDYPFNDDQLLYEFSLDFNKPCILVDVLSLDDVTDAESHPESLAGSEISEISNPSSSVDLPAPESGSPTRPPLFRPTWTPPTHTERLLSGRGGRDIDKAMYLRTRDITPKPVSCVLSLEEVRDPNNPHIRRTVRLTADDSGLGCVLRGGGPCHVGRVVRRGPAARAGIQPQQTVTQVNGRDVTSLDHAQVAQLMTSQASVTVTLVSPTVRAIS